MKSVAILTNYEYPSGLATANRVYAFERVLKKTYASAKIMVVSPEKKQEEKKYYSISENLIFRAGVEFYSIFSIFRQVRGIGPEVCILMVPSPIFLLLPLISKKTYIIDFRDVIWDYLGAQSWFRKLVGLLIKEIAAVSLRYSILITVASERQKIILESITDKKILVLANGISKERFDLLSEISRTSQPKSKGYRKIILYSGNVGLAQDLDVFIDAAQLLPDVDFVIIGAGLAFKSVGDRITDVGCRNVRLLPKVDWPILVEYIEKSSACFVSLRPEYGSAIPTKLFDYLTAGRPVVFFGPRDAAWQILEQFSGSLLLGCDSPLEEVAKSVQIAISDGYLASVDVKKNRLLIESKYLREGHLCTFIREFENVVSNL